MSDSRDRRTATDQTSDGGGTLVWASLAGVAIAVGTAGVLVGALLITPGTPDCRQYTSRSWVLCPWYRAYAHNAWFLIGAGGAVVIPTALAIGVSRALLRHGRTG